MAKEYACPVCEKGELVRKDFVGNKCPECDTPVKFIRVSGKKGTSGFHYECVVAKSEKEKVVEPANIAKAAQEKVDELSTGKGVMVSDRGNNPEVWLMEEETDDSPPRYRMIYTGMIMTGWVHCPHCEARMHKNMVVNSGAFANEHKCGNCKSIIQLVFNAPIMSTVVRA